MGHISEEEYEDDDEDEYFLSFVFGI